MVRSVQSTKSVSKPKKALTLTSNSKNKPRENSTHAIKVGRSKKKAFKQFFATENKEN